MLWKSNQRLKLQGNLRQTPSLRGPMTWKVMRRNAWKDFANLRIKRLCSCKVATPCLDDHHFLNKKREIDLLENYLLFAHKEVVLKCLYLARIGRHFILWCVNKPARAGTKWTKSCDKRLTRLISYIHHTCEFKQNCHVGNTAQQSRIGFLKSLIL